jgi:transposase-like protein
MDTSQQAVTSRDGESSVATRRLRRSNAEKLRIVEETLALGASVARVARAQAVNAYWVFAWTDLFPNSIVAMT